MRSNCIRIAPYSTGFIGMATAALEAALEAIKKRKREVDAEIQAARKSAKTAARKAAKSAKSLPSMILELDPDNLAFDVQVPSALAKHKDKQAVLALYELSGHSADVAASWLLGQGRSKREPVQYDDALRKRAKAGVEWLYIKSPDDSLATWHDAPAHRIYDLGRYIVEYALFCWLVDQNCVKGTAPSHRQLRDQASKLVPQSLPDDVKTKMVHFFLANSRATRHWMVSFRQRWGVKPGALVVGETLEPAVLHTRAPWLDSI